MKKTLLQLHFECSIASRCNEHVAETTDLFLMSQNNTTTAHILQNTGRGTKHGKQIRATVDVGHAWRVSLKSGPGSLQCLGRFRPGRWRFRSGVHISSNALRDSPEGIPGLLDLRPCTFQSSGKPDSTLIPAMLGPVHRTTAKQTFLPTREAVSFGPSGLTRILISPFHLILSEA